MADIANDPTIEKLMREIAELGFEAASEGTRIAVSISGRTLFARNERELRTVLEEMRERAANGSSPNATKAEAPAVRSSPSEGPVADESTSQKRHDELAAYALAQAVEELIVPFVRIGIPRTNS
jgi:hypothetical protein